MAELFNVSFAELIPENEELSTKEQLDDIRPRCSRRLRRADTPCADFAVVPVRAGLRPELDIGKSYPAGALAAAFVRENREKKKQPA